MHGHAKGAEQHQAHTSEVHRSPHALKSKALTLVGYTIVRAERSPPCTSSQRHRTNSASLCPRCPLLVQCLATGMGTDEEAAALNISRLNLAARAGDEGGVRALLESVPGITRAVDVAQRTALHHAAEAGSRAVVLLLLSAAPEAAMAADAAGKLPLDLAVAQTKVGKIRSRQAAADPGSHPSLSSVRAAAAQALAVVQALLAAAPKAAPSAVFEAAAHGSREALQLLLDAAGREAAAATDSKGRLPLHIAAECGSRGVVQLLLAAFPGAATMAAGDGRLPLQIAVDCNNMAAARLLLAAAPATAAVPAPGMWGALPAHTAVDRSNVRALRLLGAAAPDTLCSVDAGGWTPLHRAIQSWQRVLPMVKAIVAAAPAAATVPDFAEGKLPLLIAMERGQADCVEALILAAPATAGVVRDSQNRTPLMWAVQRRLEGLVKVSSSAAASPGSGVCRTCGRELFWRARRPLHAVLCCFANGMGCNAAWPYAGASPFALQSKGREV